MGGVPEVAQRRADHVPRQQVAQLLLLALPAASLQVDRRLGRHLRAAAPPKPNPRIGAPLSAAVLGNLKDSGTLECRDAR